MSSKLNNSHRSFNNIVMISTGISLAFIIVVYLIIIMNFRVAYRYLILFTISFVFSSILFYVIFKQQEQLKAERKQLITLFQHVSDGILILDENKNIIEMNEAARDLLGGVGMSNFFCDICQDSHGQIKICEYDKCFLDFKKLSYYELQLKHLTKGKIPVSVSTSTYFGTNQKLLTIVSIRNISEYRKTERSRINNMVTTSMIKAQEKERKRLSRELHDGIGQSIFSILLGLEYLIPQLKNEELKGYVTNLRNTTKQTLEEIRHMAVELRPSVLDDLGLVAALKSYIKTFGETFGIQINFEYSANKQRLPSNMETALYRISQEALTNAAKYADTDRIDLSLTNIKNEVILTITDYGKGFSVDDIFQREKGVGLYSMEERAAMLNGSFHITSQVGKGTEIKVRISLE
ncbi:hypothetical protein BHF71_06570 [Vulcanibacillus modesticaldus]|uniref:histidine kinase n=1 Tax=Vulcanibacillus modesticaldus TaxID=337097 RepID=A0A1D2YW98_9BACI|nr:histidine kinase [Vulcanibacillus modesticaldus]OEG00021.1 hypothetical protein BHF71_06570 [Vulcanibacillus modesticaldus]